MMMINYPYLTYGWQQDASPVDSSEVPHTDDCDESVLAKWSAGILGVAMHRYVCETLRLTDFPLECIQAIVKLLYLVLWTHYILYDARLSGWRLARVDGRGRPMKLKRLYAPMSFACRNAQVSTLYIWDRNEGETLLAQSTLFCTSMRRRGTLNSDRREGGGGNGGGIYTKTEECDAFSDSAESSTDEEVMAVAHENAESLRVWKDCLCRVS